MFLEEGSHAEKIWFNQIYSFFRPSISSYNLTTKDFLWVLWIHITTQLNAKSYSYNEWAQLGFIYTNISLKISPEMTRAYES